MSTFRSAIRKLTEHLTSEDVQSMRFLCESAIPTGRLEKTHDALTLFQALEEHGKLSANNLYFLNSLLEGINKTHLMSLLTEEVQKPPFISRRPCPYRTTGLQRYPEPHCDQADRERYKGNALLVPRPQCSSDARNIGKRCSRIFTTLGEETDNSPGQLEQVEVGIE